jgi:preprotein translocase subunit SecG
MTSVLVVFIALIGVLLMASVLIQNPKGGGIDPNFGGQAQQLFGAARSTDFIEKATWVLAIALLVLCVAMVWMIGTSAPTGVEAVPLQSQ